jgi:hypothetical protein
VVKNLGTPFCKLDEEKVSEHTLSKKKKSPAPGGSKQTKKNNTKSSNNRDTSKAPSKKHKK